MSRTTLRIRKSTIVKSQPEMSSLNFSGLTQLNLTRNLFEPALYRPLRGLFDFLHGVPGAYAPGFMLATCSAGATASNRGLGDPEISRVHATLTLDDKGQFWLTPKGRNPTLVSGRELPREQRTVVQPDEKIAICAYTLRIQPK